MRGCGCLPPIAGYQLSHLVVQLEYKCWWALAYKYLDDRVVLLPLFVPLSDVFLTDSVSNSCAHGNSPEIFPEKLISRRYPGDTLSNATLVTDLGIWQIFKAISILKLFWHFSAGASNKGTEDSYNYVAIPPVNNSLKICLFQCAYEGLYVSVHTMCIVLCTWKPEEGVRCLVNENAIAVTRHVGAGK